jgi:hypothetical protein
LAVSDEDDAPEPPLLGVAAAPSLELDDPAPSDEAALAAAFVRALLAVDRSFFAQPAPLKWTAADETAFVKVPSAPQLGQNRGPASWMPWITSVRCRQFEQM